MHSSVSFAPLYGLEGANFDPRKMHWIGSLNTASAMCVAWHASGIKTWEDMLQKGFVVGTSGAGSQMETMPAMLNKLFGAKIKIISGYKGGNEVFLAMERGEVHGRCGGLVNSIKSTRPEWFPEKKVACADPARARAQRALSRRADGGRVRQGRENQAGAAADFLAAGHGPPDPGAARRAGRAGGRLAQGL